MNVYSGRMIRVRFLTPHNEPRSGWYPPNEAWGVVVYAINHGCKDVEVKSWDGEELEDD